MRSEPDFADYEEEYMEEILFDALIRWQTLRRKRFLFGDFLKHDLVFRRPKKRY